MPRAILIPADADPEWITLDAADIIGDLRKHLGGWCDFAILLYNVDRKGIHLAVNERSLLDTFPRNTLASEIVYELGKDYHVYGPVVFMGLDGSDTVDLTEAQWEFLTGVSQWVAAEPRTEG